MAGDLEIKVQWYTEFTFLHKIKRSYNHGGLKKIKGCKIEGPLCRHRKKIICLILMNLDIGFVTPKFVVATLFPRSASSSICI